MYYLPIYLHIKMQIYNFAVLTINTHNSSVTYTTKSIGTRE